DAWYHVIARGTDRRVIFETIRDHRHWLELVPELTERFGLQVFAFIMMPNHYHLVVNAPQLNLSRAMQWFQTSYSMWFNRKHDRVGPLFQGRFKAVIIEPAVFGLELSRYVHLNPVRTSALGLDKQTRRAARIGIDCSASAETIRQR